jgi:glycosyltransferase involved in cell wall biosynthesis
LALARGALAVPVGYLGVLTVSAWVATARRSPRDPAPTKRFAVLVPAHDEEAVIADTLAALARLDHDDHTVHVVADHCTDRTVELARAAGADVMENASGARGKGPALQWLLHQVLDDADLAGRAIDAVVVVDADTIVAPGFLAAASARLAAGAVVVQGQYRVLDPGRSTATALRSAALAVRHHLRPLGRTSIGGSCGLFGNGMVFATDVLRTRHWSDHLTEDIELQNELLLDGILVAYEPDAVVEAAMPTTLAAARTQNERWERGRIELARRFVPKLAGLARRDPDMRLAAADAILDHVVPPLSVLAAATTATAAAGTLTAAVRGTRLTRGWWLPAALVAHVGSALVLSRAPAAVYRALLHAPAMVLWKVRLWGRMLVRPGAEGWARTARDSNVASPVRGVST